MYICFKKTKKNEINTLKKKKRNTAERDATTEKRQKSSEVAVKVADRIKPWEALVTYSSSLDLIFTSDDTFVRLCKLSDYFLHLERQFI